MVFVKSAPHSLSSPLRPLAMLAFAFILILLSLLHIQLDLILLPTRRPLLLKTAPLLVFLGQPLRLSLRIIPLQRQASQVFTRAFAFWRRVGDDSR